jgi:hypothetical protein
MEKGALEPRLKSSSPIHLYNLTSPPLIRSTLYADGERTFSLFQNPFVILICLRRAPGCRGTCLIQSNASLPSFSTQRSSSPQFRSNPPDGEGLCLVACPQKWVKPRNVKVFGFPSPRRFRSRVA